jgi:hypothetical protein
MLGRMKCEKEIWWTYTKDSTPKYLDYWYLDSKMLMKKKKSESMVGWDQIVIVKVCGVRKVGRWRGG